MSVFKRPETIFTGKNAIWEAGAAIAACGQKALIVTGPHVGHSLMMETLKSVLQEYQIKYSVFSEITGEPTDEMVEAGKQIYLREQCDFFIGIGGGSPLDAAKAIAAILDHTGSIADFAGIMIEKEIPPLIAIPTTAGTGSEATKFTIITDLKKDIKMLLKGDCLLPRIAVCDPEFTESSSPSITASTGLDALTHAVEAYTSVKAVPLTDALAVSAIKRIMKYLPKVYLDGSDKKAREEMSVAALEAGICINNSSVTIVHGMSRPIGALFHVPHGLSNAMLLTKCLTYVADGAYDRFAELAYETNAADRTDPVEVAAVKFLQSLETICRICEVPTLLEYGISKEEFTQYIEKMAKDAIASGSPGNTRKQVDANDCERIYRSLYEQ
ncbi:MAG: iron-containing alcohol dehydrogenase [Lachnospiraceae bacterium]